MEKGSRVLMLFFLGERHQHFGLVSLRNVANVAKARCRILRKDAGSGCSLWELWVAVPAQFALQKSRPHLKLVG